MPSHSRRIRETITLGLLIAIALVLSYFEQFIPVNIGVPGIKIGLANVVTLLAIGLYKPTRVYTIILVRVTLAAFIMGRIIGLWYSLSGGVLSGTAMLVMYYTLKDKVSIIGISVVGAICHNIGQMIAVTIITGSSLVALTYFPALMVSGVITGIFIGLVARYTKPYLAQSLS